jgi:hypothetical protein
LDLLFARPDRPVLLASNPTPSFPTVVMHVTDLPPEILLLILDRLGPSAFAVAVITCKKFRYVALENRKLLLNKIRCVPGPKQGLEDLTNAEIFRLFRRRAAENLLNVQILHDRQIFSFEPSATSSIHASQSSLSGRLSPNAALVCRNCPLVHLYNFCGHELIPMGVVDALGACDHVSAISDILKVAHNDCGGISILSRPAEPCEPTRMPREVYITHLYTPWPRSWRTSWGLAKTPEYQLPQIEAKAKFRAVAMAVERPGLFAISWKRVDRLARAQVWSYEAKKSTNDSKTPFDSESLHYISEKVYESPRIERLSEPHAIPSISSLDFTPGLNEGHNVYRLDLSNPAQPVPYGFRRIPGLGTVDSLNDPVVDYVTYVDLGSEDDPDELQFAVGKPFFGCHTHAQIGCHCHYLALGSSIDDADTVLILSKKVQNDMCQRTVNLSAVNRNAGSWEAAAHLAGYKRPDTNLHGVVAYSPGSTRIAIANWTNIYIWPFEPRQLIGERFHDEYYHHRRGQQPVILFPAIIPVGSVVHQLAFGADSEDVLWALTNKGLIVFNIGPSCDKKVRTHAMVVGNTNEEVDGAPGYFVDGRKDEIGQDGDFEEA